MRRTITLAAVAAVFATLGAFLAYRLGVHPAHVAAMHFHTGPSLTMHAHTDLIHRVVARLVLHYHSGPISHVVRLLAAKLHYHT